MLNMRKVIIILFSLVAIACVLIILSINQQSGQQYRINNNQNLNEEQNRRPGESPDEPSRSLSPQGYAAIISQEILKKAEANLPEEGLRPGATHLSADGVRILLPYEYTSNTPIIELHFMARELNGNIHPIKLENISLERKEPPSGRGYTMNGATILRVGVTDHFYKHMMRPLLLGAEYEVLNYRLVGVNGPIRGPSPAFRVPENLGPDEIYKIKLLLVDKIYEHQELQKQKAAAQRRKRLEIEEAITVTIQKDAIQGQEGPLVCLYSVGEKNREFHNGQSSGQMTLKGPNKLGGELVVYTSPPGQHFRSWCYIKNLQKRNVSIPDDADWSATREDLIEVYLSFPDEQKQFLDSWQGVIFYPSKASNVRLFGALLHVGSIQLTNYGKVPLKIVPGKYYMKALVIKGRTEVFMPIGQLEIGKEPGKTYTINLPSDK